jgi:hypothetical protein
MRASPPLLLVGFAAPAVAWAGKAESVLEEVKAGKYEDARKRCEKWEATAPAAEAALRAACADAYWPLAEAKNTVEEWAAFGQTWANTPAQADAFVRQATLALRGASATATESELLAMARTYAGTEVEADFQSLARTAAIRDVNSTDKAVAVAERYPDHPALPSLVEKFPNGFLRVSISHHEVDVTVVPDIPLRGALTPKTGWVARDPTGKIVAWDTFIAPLLEQDGLSALSIEELRNNTEGEPPLPLCYSPRMPPGWGPAAQVKVGVGAIDVAVDYDPECTGSAPPTFLTLVGESVAAVSLAPGHRVDLRATTVAKTGRSTATAWLSVAPDVRLADRSLWQKAGDAWLVRPLSGGTPWMTRSAPPDGNLLLGSSLLGSGLPTDWKLELADTEMVVRAPATAATGDWHLVPGDIRILSPLMQMTIGLDPTAAKPRAKAAPVFDAQAGWSLAKDGTLIAGPPAGAVALTPHPLDQTELAAAVAHVVALGFAAGDVVALDGYGVNLDYDPAEELVLRLVLRELGAVAVVDLGGSNPRVTLVGTERVRVGTKPADAAFPFAYAGLNYLAWGGREATGKRAKFVEIVRFDGDGFTVEGFELP